MEEKEKIQVQIDELRVARGNDIDAITALVREMEGVVDKMRDLQEELEEKKNMIETLTEIVNSNEDDLERLEEMLDELEEEEKQ